MKEGDEDEKGEWRWWWEKGFDADDAWGGLGGWWGEWERWLVRRDGDDVDDGVMQLMIKVRENCNCAHIRDPYRILEIKHSLSHTHPNRGAGADKFVLIITSSFFYC